MFKFWGNQEQDPQPRPQDVAQSWYPPSVVGGSSPGSSRPGTPSGSSSTGFGFNRPSDSPSHVSPAEAAGVIALLKDKSVDDLRKLLSDKDAYNQFLFSLDQVKIQNNIRDELRKETLQLARGNLDKEPRIVELRNQTRFPFSSFQISSAGSYEQQSWLLLKRNSMSWKERRKKCWGPALQLPSFTNFKRR
ncbi:Vacuolar protein-sorting-associated protein 37 homolog 2 [Linum perenne]